MVMQVCHYKIHIGYKIASTVPQQETLYDERFFEMAGYRLAQCCRSCQSGQLRLRNKNEKSASTLTTLCGVSGGFEDAMRQERSLYADFLANIDKTFGDFHLTANVGASIYHTSMDQLYIAGDLVFPTSSRSTILISPPTINRTLPDMKMKFKVFLPVLN